MICHLERTFFIFENEVLLTQLEIICVQITNGKMLFLTQFLNKRFICFCLFVKKTLLTIFPTTTK